MPPLVATLRTYGYRAVTRLTARRLHTLKTTLPGRGALGLAQRLLGGGPLVIPGGPAAGLRLARGLRLTHVQGYGLVRGSLEPSVQEALRRHVAPGMVVYDIGANIGLFALLAGRLVGETGSVVAFEPSPENAHALRANVDANGMTHVSVHEAAVCSRTGRARFLQVAEQSWSHLADRGLHPDTEAIIEVDVVAVDDLIERGTLRPPDVVKIDVEGSELDVISGMRHALESASPIVICELHETNTEFVDAMTEYGYAIGNLDRPIPVADDGPTHAFAVPRRRLQATVW